MRLAIIGCGTIAQVMHLPYAIEVPEVDLRALVDPDGRRRRTLADRYNVPATFEAVGDLLAADDVEVDAVVVLTPPHTHVDAILPALEAGLDVLVEKPLAVSPDDADRLVEAAEAAEGTAMVAYMKRYDAAYERLQEHLAELDEPIDLITAYDVDPNHGRVLEEVYDLVGADLSAEFLAESTRARHAEAVAAVGGRDADAERDLDVDEFADDYDWHLEHVCHDVNALRGLFGDVDRIDHVDVYADGRYATAHLVYEGGRRCVLDSGLSDRKWFEEWLRIDAPDRTLELDFSNPFIRNTPTTLRVAKGREEIEETTYTPSYDEPFKRELERFVRCAEEDVPVRTTFAEARDDVVLIADLFRAYRGVPLRGMYDGG
jgi:predicted dehydrogenase